MSSTLNFIPLKTHLPRLLQDDILNIYTEAGVKVASYTYDAWGNHTVTNHTIDNIGDINPFRYRGYYFDVESNFYFLNTRYYDPQIKRFISSDVTVTLTDTPMSLTDKNLYAYCDNNPVMRVDNGGQFWDTFFDVISLGMSVIEVVATPYDPWAWAGLVGDALDLIPFVSGVGEITRAVNTGRKTLDKADDVVDIAKRLSQTEKVADKIKDATGSYEIIFESGKNYVGKGGFKRAIKSAEIHRMDDTGKIVDKVTAIRWRSAPDKNSAFISEYFMQTKNGVGINNQSTYNKIWSPGKKYFDEVLTKWKI